MGSQTKICQNCKSEFVIEPEDFEFYEKINVPPPTWCPDCRMVRRMIWRNERCLYKRKCDVSGHTEDSISIYPKTSQFTVYDRKYWWSDAWDPTQYGQDYNFSKPFFQQYAELLHRTPRASLDQKNAVNSEYTNFVVDIKDCYYAFAMHDSEFCYFTSANNAFSKDCIDIMRTRNSELCYETISCSHCYNLSFSKYCIECSNSRLLYDCHNCQDCFGCIGLRNKQYHIFNEPYSAEEYKKKIATLHIESYSAQEESRQKFNTLLSRYPRKYAMIIKSNDVSGDEISSAKDCHHCFFVQPGSEHAKYCLTLIDGAKDIYDSVGAGLNAELQYETVSGVGQNLFFSSQPWNDHHIWLSNICFDSSYLFACIGLRNKSYCILNKQYTKEEYEALVPRIIQHMNDMPYIDKKGRVYKYGEFFPPELSPFCYNETIAQEYFPLTKEQAIEQGYRWKDLDEKSYNITMTNNKIPDHIKDVQDSILQETIGCASKDNSDSEGRRSCPNEFETSYAPERPEIVYCETCYQCEVV